MGPTEAIPIIPKVSSLVLRFDMVAEIPTPSARIKGTEMSPVVAPLPSKASATNSSGTNITVKNIRI
ncbi:hypothetical protein D3C81_2184160 [compost metagenome]